MKMQMKVMMTMTESSGMIKVMRMREGLVGAGVVPEEGGVGEGVEGAKRWKNQQVMRRKENSQILLPCPLLVGLK